MGKSKVTRKPTVIGVDPEFKLTCEECKRRRIDPVLSELKVKHWTNLLKLSKCALQTSNKLGSAEVMTRRVTSFFASVASSFATNIGLSKYSQACKGYFSNDKNIGDLQAIFLAKLQEKELGVLAEKTKEKVQSLRIRTNAQKELATAAKEYQSAKFEADSLLQSLGIVSTSSSQESTTREEPIVSNQTKVLDVENVFTNCNQTDSIGKIIKHDGI
jgi:hypothetical protein